MIDERELKERSAKLGSLLLLQLLNENEGVKKELADLFSAAKVGYLELNLGICAEVKEVYDRITHTIMTGPVTLSLGKGGIWEMKRNF